MDLLRAPSGWMIFAFLLPFALAGIRAGWLLKSNGSAAKGWATTIVASGSGVIACMAALLRLL